MDEYRTKRGKPLVFKAFAWTLIVLLVAGGLSPLYIFVHEYLDRRAYARLTSLNYPDPTPQHADLLVFEEHNDGINIRTPWVPIKLSDDNLPGAVCLQLRTRILGPARINPDEDVSFELAAERPLQLPSRQWQSNPLAMFVSEYSYYGTNAYLMDLATNIKPRTSYFAGQRRELVDHMLYSVPTADFIRALEYGSIIIELGGHSIVLDDRAMTYLSEFASTLKVGYEPLPANIP